MGRGPRLPRALVEPHADLALAALGEHFPSAKVCGSLRRGDPTVGDVDIVVAGPTIATPDLAFALMLATFTGVEIIGPGDRPRVQYRIHDLPRIPYLDIDVWTVPEERWGAALLYTTGPGPLNVVMRRWALRHGMELLLDGVYDAEGELVASVTEEECCAALGWPVMPPEQRSDYRRWTLPFSRHLDMLDRQRDLPVAGEEFSVTSSEPVPIESVDQIALTIPQ